MHGNYFRITTALCHLTAVLSLFVCLFACFYTFGSNASNIGELKMYMYNTITVTAIITILLHTYLSRRLSLQTNRESHCLQTGSE